MAYMGGGRENASSRRNSEPLQEDREFEGCCDSSRCPPYILFPRFRNGRRCTPSESEACYAAASLLGRCADIFPERLRSADLQLGNELVVFRHRRLFPPHTHL